MQTTRNPENPRIKHRHTMPRLPLGTHRAQARALANKHTSSTHNSRVPEVSMPSTPVAQDTGSR